MYEKLKAKWEMGYISKDTLRGWVALNVKHPGKGITPEEYREITGEAMPEEGGDGHESE